MARAAGAVVVVAAVVASAEQEWRWPRGASSLAPERAQQHLGATSLDAAADLPQETAEQLGARCVFQVGSVAAGEAGCFIAGPPPRPKDQWDRPPCGGYRPRFFIHPLGGRQTIPIGPGTLAWSGG